MASYYGSDEYFLALDLDKYTIYWFVDHCAVDVDTGEAFSYKEGIDLPLLPFNISLEKLKTYLTFA